jgi:nucleoside-diphosphate-sugar epimerase
MKRVLLTGASGFIGRHCWAPLLERGFEVCAVSSRDMSSGDKADVDDPVRWFRADLLDRSRIEPLLAEVRPTHLLHLAWMVVPGQSYDSLDNLRWVQSSLDLTEAFARQGGRRVVVAGTCYEYDQRYGLCHEDRTPRAPDTRYGVAKNALQELLSAFAPSWDVSFAWPRLFFLYGPHEHPRRLVSSVICSLLSGEPANCSHGRQLRDYLHAADAADALAAILDSDLAGPVNVGSGVPVSLRSIVEEVGRQLDRTDLLRLGAIPARPGETPLVAADTTRLAESLGWRPRINLSDGIERTIRWWQENLITQ